MLSCVSNKNITQEAEIETEKTNQKLVNIKSKYSYDIFGDEYFSFTGISKFNCDVDLNVLKEFKAEHYDYFGLNKEWYDSGCYLISKLDSIGSIIPIIIYLCPNFDNNGYLYTIDANYNIIDSMNIFSCYWSSGGDGPYECSGETESFFSGNIIKSKTINYVWIRETEETIITDSVVVIYHIDRDGRIIKDFEEKYIISKVP